MLKTLQDIFSATPDAHVFKAISRIFEKFLGPLIETEFGIKEAMSGYELDGSEDAEEMNTVGQALSQPSTQNSSNEDPQRIRALQATYTNKCKQVVDRLFGTLLPKLAKQCQNYITAMVSEILPLLALHIMYFPLNVWNFNENSKCSHIPHNARNNNSEHSH